MQAIKTENLNFIYSINTPFEKAAVKDVCIEIEKGDYVGVIGHTGSGKSTLVQHLNGLLKPTSGKIFIDGQDIWEKPKKIGKIRFKVGLVFQYPEYQLFDETIYKDIAFGPKNMGLSSDEVDLRVREAANFVGINPEILDKSPFELSGGQKRRAAIAGVIAMQPDILILDEPTAGLDPKGRDSILGHIREFHQEKKSTVLLVSHSMEDIAKNANKVLVMNKAQVAMCGNTAEVFSHAKELEKMGLDIPQVTKIFFGLHDRGIMVSTSIFTVGQAKSEILRLLSEVNGNA